MRKKSTPRSPGTRKTSETTMEPWFSVRLPFHPKKMRTASQRDRQVRMVSSVTRLSFG